MAFASDSKTLEKRKGPKSHPATVSKDPLLAQLVNSLGIPCETVGKETHTFVLETGMRLIYTSDFRNRYSQKKLDHVRDRGAVITALRDHTGHEILDPAGILHDLISSGSAVAVVLHDVLPRKLIQDPEFQKRTMIVRDLRVIPYKCVGRAFIDGRRLPEPCIAFYQKDFQHFTEPVPIKKIREEFPSLEDEFRKLFATIAAQAQSRGQELEDLTCRAGFEPIDPGQIVWCEKVGVRGRFFRGNDTKRTSILEGLYGDDRRTMTTPPLAKAFEMRTGKRLDRYQRDTMLIDF